MFSNTLTGYRPYSHIVRPNSPQPTLSFLISCYDQETSCASFLCNYLFSISSSFLSILFFLFLDMYYCVKSSVRSSLLIACVADALNLLYRRTIFTNTWAGCNAGYTFKGTDSELNRKEIGNRYLDDRCHVSFNLSFARVNMKRIKIIV